MHKFGFHLKMKSFNVQSKYRGLRTFIITEMTFVRFDLIVNTRDVNLKSTA